MINHLTGFLNKCVLAFKRDNHRETSSSALVNSVSRMTSFLVINPYSKVNTAGFYSNCGLWLTHWFAVLFRGMRR